MEHLSEDLRGHALGFLADHELLTSCAVCASFHNIASLLLNEHYRELVKALAAGAPHRVVVPTLPVPAVGMYGIIVVTHTGRAFSCGADFLGELGLGLTSTGPYVCRWHGVPTEVAGEVQQEQLVAASIGRRHTLLVTKCGRLWSCGSDDHGASGNASMSRAAPVLGALEHEQLVAVSAGLNHSVALSADGRVFTFGARQSVGRLGGNQPAAVDGLPPIVSIAAGANATLAVDTDGGLWVWGGGMLASLAFGGEDPNTRNPRVRSISLPGGLRVADVSVGSAHIIVSSAGCGRVWAWGDNTIGQLGTGDRSHRSQPTEFALPEPAISVAAGDNHSVCAGRGGATYSWGHRAYTGHGMTVALRPVHRAFRPGLGSRRLACGAPTAHLGHPRSSPRPLALLAPTRQRRLCRPRFSPPTHPPPARPRLLL